MKDIYELLNDVKLDEKEFIEVEVNDLEKAKVLNTLKTSIKRKKKWRGWKMNVAAAAMFIGLSTAMVGLTFPAYAGDIPVVGDIFRFLDNGRTGLYDNYKEFSTEVNMTEESKGVAITINDAIFDGETIAVTYSVKSEKPLGDNPFIMDTLGVRGTNRMSGSLGITKVDDYNYVGLITASNFEEDDRDVVHFKWDIDRIMFEGSDEAVNGSWKFALSVKATDAEVTALNHVTEQDGVQLTMTKLAVNPMSYTVSYDIQVAQSVKDKWDAVEVDLAITDDLGNVYEGQNNGGYGENSYDHHTSKTFQKLDPKATKLFVTPHIVLRNYSTDDSGGVEITKDGVKEIVSTNTKSEREEHTQEEIVIDLQK
ncbi:DUF4179 domain-containing protein [Psychrobacillus sp.]|uniref:DUF4179 domain-containing protein n=1 Tax=Psychrobacillus sp. TaxID=1871623 RepID=UPI0028BD9ABF|nr:DUF4179 domain-containing protein [Psychrobacillus sp.]